MPSSSEPGAEALRPAPEEERPLRQAEPDVAPAGAPPWGTVREQGRDTLLLVLLRALSAWHT